MATTVWKGHLTFGLISMPVRMFAAARGERISFNQLHKECHSRLKQPLFCPVCNRNVEESGYGAIAKLTMHQREHIVIVRPGTRGMTLHTMFYSNEIRAAESAPADKIEVKEQEKKLARQLIESLAAPFEPQKYRDEYQENLRTMIAAKLRGQEVTEVAQPHMAPVIDLMEALKKSLAEKQAPPAAAAPALAAEAPVGKKPPARAVQPISSVQKRAGKKIAG